MPTEAQQQQQMLRQQQQMVWQQLESCIGQEYVIRFLTSDAGRQLNGRKCVVTSHNGERLQVRLKDDSSAFNVKLQNLLPAEMNYCGHTSAPGTELEDAKVLDYLRRACSHQAVTSCNKDSRCDVAARVAFIRQHLDSSSVPPPSACGDVMAHVPDGHFVKCLQLLRPCCAGDNTVDFRRFNSGLVGNGSTCAVCTEQLEQSNALGALGFPCGHLFHNACAAEWLKGHNTCPICRFQLGMPGQEYSELIQAYEQRLSTRIREWFISGMCERCQASYQEADPLCTVQLPNGKTALVPRSQLPTDAVPQS